MYLCKSTKGLVIKVTKVLIMRNVPFHVLSFQMCKNRFKIADLQAHSPLVTLHTTHAHRHTLIDVCDIKEDKQNITQPVLPNWEINIAYTNFRRQA